MRSTAPPGAGATLDRLLVGAAPADPAVVDGPLRLSGTDLASSAAAVAGAWQAQGVEPGDVVAWQLPNWHEALACFHACWSLGAVAAPLHHRAGEQELTRHLDVLQPRVVLGAPGLPVTTITEATLVRGDGGYESLLTHPPARATPVTPETRAVVLFTAGSSAAPKGVVHTHRSLGHKARMMAGVHGLDWRDVVLMPAPLAHVSGLLNGVLLPAAAGMTVVLMERWDTGRALELIEAEQVSFMVGPPTFFLGLLDDPAFTTDRVASLRLISCGGTDVTPAFVERARRKPSAHGSSGAMGPPRRPPSRPGTWAIRPSERPRVTAGRSEMSS